MEIQNDHNIRKPPITFEEWLTYNNLDTWPHDVEEDPELEMQLKSSYEGYECLEKVYNDTRQRVSFQSNSLDEIFSRVVQFEEKMNRYTSFFFDTIKEKADSVPRFNEKYRASFDLAMTQVVEDEDKNVVFPGFYSHELTSLPGSLEAPQLLNYVTQLQNIPMAFKKIWRKFFLSDLSAAILQDAFWWIFLDSEADKKANHAHSQVKLFHRLSNSFAALFLSIPYKDKDEFFKYFVSCMSQAIYCSFCSAFPHAGGRYCTDEFRLQMLTLVGEWVTGTHPHVEQILPFWDLQSLESEIKHEHFDEKQMKSSMSFDEVNFMYGPQVRSVDDEGTTIKLASPINTYVKESHPVSSGPLLNRVSFDIFGRSPLIRHFLSSKDMRKENAVIPKTTVTRTEITENNIKHNHQTYAELIKEHKKELRHRQETYQRVTADITKECQAVELQRVKEQQNLIKTQDDLLKKNVDVKILSQKILDTLKRVSEDNFVIRQCDGT